ncbi:membrane protein [Streptomyces sp. F-3]|uniref:Zf-HC2 domain-containing protein n=1 Tax=Streptomyces thermogriseus TaxID=75292 RepID=A0ABN1SV85_9ACTN|nr:MULTISPECIES: zf-HC2 domain-containing protein [unclassified Streptomyces]MDN5383842.1 zf-HC2 domain-containing protein [Streptomyces sp. LB8]GAT79607.1 membrane protein [Streptomyces sp. F-3]
MRSLERHGDVGAYALGVLDEAEAFRFEDHLMECPRCAAHVAEFGPTTRQLMLYRRATPRFVHPMAQPGPGLLDRLLGEVARRRRAGRRRLLYGLAASVVLAVSGPAVVLAAGQDDGPVQVAATDASTGVWAEVKAADRDWGSALEVRVRDGSGPHSCRLVVVGRDSSEETVAGWKVSAHDGRAHTMSAGTTMHTGQIDHFEVRTDQGQRLVTLDVR